MSKDPLLIDYKELNVGVGIFSTVTLRDLFAAAALAGLAANPESLAEWTPDEMIRRAFSDADAMLEERAKRGRS